MIPLTRRQPTRLVVPAAAAVVAAAGFLLAYHYRQNVSKEFTVAGLSVIAGVAVLALPYVEPVYPTVAGFALSVFSGDWGYLGIPLGLDKPLLVYGIAAVFVQALPDQKRRDLPTMGPLRWLIVLVGLYAIGSAAVSGTLTSHSSLFALLDQFGLLGFALFILAPSIFVTARDRDVLLITLIALGAYLGWVSFFEGIHVSALVFPSYINDPSIGIHAGRARGPFLEAVANGLGLYACSVAAVMGLVRWKHRPAVRGLCGLIVLVSVLGIFFTVTREVWIGSAVATAVAMVFEPRLRIYLVPTAILTAIVVVLALAFVPGLQSNASSREEDKQSLWDRYNSDAAGLRMLDARPLLGFGWYEFGPNSFPYYRQASSYPLTTVGRIHNVYLGVAVDLGLVGFASWLISLLGAIFDGLRRRGPPEGELWRVGLVAVAVNWIIIANFTPLTYALPNHLIWMWSGIAVSATRPLPIALRRPDLTAVLIDAD